MARDITALVGAFNLSDVSEIAMTKVPINKTYVHPEWNPLLSSFDADIAMLELSVVVSYNQYVQPICLIHPNHDSYEITSIKDGVIVAYGYDENKNYGGTPKLMTTPLLTRNECFEKNSTYESMISSQTICGGYLNETGVCTGDSGSGVIVLYEQKYFLRGIVSASYTDELGSCDVSRHSILTNVTKFYNWIEDVFDRFE